jgi:hypothetical protein
MNLTPAAPFSLSTPRESMRMAYDNDSKQLLLFGGEVPQGVMNDTYKLVKRQ